MTLLKKSFKQSMIAIAFSGMYMEALLALLGIERLGNQLWKKIERNTTYEEKLALLGFREPELLANCKRFREVRNDLMHEKAVNLESLKTSDISYAQEEAEFSVKFIKSIQSELSKHP